MLFPLDCSSICSSLLLDECQEVLQHCTAVEAAVDDVLIAQGERDPSMYIVLKGQVSVYCDHKIFGVGQGAGGDPLGATNIAAFGGGDANDDDSGVLALLKMAASKAESDGREKAATRRRHTLLELPLSASRQSSISGNSALLLPPRAISRRGSADVSLLLPPPLSPRRGSVDIVLLVPPTSTPRRVSAQLEIPPLGPRRSSANLEASPFGSRRGSALLELPPSVTRRGRVATLLMPPTTVQLLSNQNSVYCTTVKILIIKSILISLRPNV